MLFDRIEPGSSRTDKECSFGAGGKGATRVGATDGHDE